VDDLVSILELVLYIAAILALSMAVTWAVVKISPSESAKEQKSTSST
jgi:flagellar biogenesis protein FliO